MLRVKHGTPVGELYEMVENVETNSLSIFIGHHNNESSAPDNRNETANSLCAPQASPSLFLCRTTVRIRTVKHLNHLRWLVPQPGGPLR